MDGSPLGDKTQMEILAGLRALSQDLRAVLAGQDRVLAAVEQVNGALRAHNEKVLLGVQTGPLVLPIGPGSSLPAAQPRRAPTASVSWVIGPPENAGWAYGNNARRLSGNMPEYDHVIGAEAADIAVYFDVIVAERYPVKARHSIVRIGGPRPLQRLYENDPTRIAHGLSRFDAVVVLNLALYRQIAPLHPRVVLIPNALDLKEWHTGGRSKTLPAEFTVGFAASAMTSGEIKVKGGDVAMAAAEKTGVRLRQLQRGDGSQIPHERMREEFYSRCHVLVHPVRPGREGSSNVIMEAIACGVPVITTRHSGLHGDLLEDRKSALIREPEVEGFAEAIETLRSDRKLRDRIAAAARDFAERHHDISIAARSYARLIEEVRAVARAPRQTEVGFLPFWTPTDAFGSSRLRVQYPVEMLQEIGWSGAHVGLQDQDEIVLVSQSADNPVMERLEAESSRFVIYDVCDRYFENPRLFKRPDGEVNSQARFEQLIARADLVTVPTRELKVEIARRYPAKPVTYIPETIDYDARRRPFVHLGPRVVLWFGNPDRGNFESSRWILEHLRDRHSYTPLIVSRPGFFKKNHPDLVPHVVEWSVNAMEEAFAAADLCVVSHSDEEQTKSPNRLITAVMHGLPTLVSNSPSCAEIMRAAQMDFAVVPTIEQLDRAMIKVEDPLRRKPFVEKLQRYLLENFSRATIGKIYQRLLEKQTFSRGDGRKLRVGFVSHNLVLGEGAPWSLYELAAGLSTAGHVEAFAFSPCGGPLAKAYQGAGVPLEIFDPTISHVSKALNRRFAPLRKQFLAWLRANRIEALVCNTAKSGAFAHMARELGVPSIVIVRESFDAKNRYSDFTGEARFSTELGVSQAEGIVFVARTSREAWEDHKFFGEVSIIPNGVNPDRFRSSLDADKAALRQELGLPADKVVALCVGTVNKRKGQGGILNAFAALPAEVREKAHVVFLGALENSYLPEFEAMLAAQPAEIRDRVLLVRATPEVGNWYRAADFLLMNSTSEAYPRSVVEALLFGLPVLSTAVFGVQEQVTHGENGYLYPFDAMDDWSTHFTRLVQDDARRTAMSAQAGRSFWKLVTHAEMLHAYRAQLMRLATASQTSQAA